MRKTVAITGIGVIAPNGCGRDEFWSNCLRGLAIAEEIPSHWNAYNSYNSRVWAPLQLPDWDQFSLNRAEKMQMDPVQLLSLVCGEMALKDAGLKVSLKDEKKNTFSIEGIDVFRSGVFMGTGNGGLVSYTRAQATHVLAPVKKALDSMQDACALPDSPPLEFSSRFNPFVVAMTMPNACSAVLSIKYGLAGPSITVSTACASGTSAIGQAYRAIVSGKIDTALAGGAEYLADPYGGIFRGFDTAGTLARGDGIASEANRPFDSKRTGFLFSAGGCAVLMMEDATLARARGAKVIAEVVGFSENCDAFSIMGMSPEGDHVESMYNTLFESSGFSAGQVDYINAHGTSTLLNDEVESRIVERVFGSRPFINSTKSLIGHSIGAAGAIETAVTALSIESGKMHPSVNLTDPIRPLNFVVHEPCGYPITLALNQSFGFGGHIAGLLLKSPSPQ